jgi:hypothetical protein
MSSAAGLDDLLNCWAREGAKIFSRRRIGRCAGLKIRRYAWVSGLPLPCRCQWQQNPSLALRIALCTTETLPFRSNIVNNRDMTIRYSFATVRLKFPLSLPHLLRLVSSSHITTVIMCASTDGIVEAVEHIPYHRDYPDAPLAILRCHEKPAPQE